jgi:4'-phosphopantetheinyl transferase
LKPIIRNLKSDSEMIALKNTSRTERSVSHSFTWETPPDAIAVEPDHIHIWKVYPKEIPNTREVSSTLSLDERNRAARLIDPVKWEHFRSARFALRTILSGYMHMPLEKIQFSYQGKGKPFIEQDTQKTSISFNITHIADLMLVAVSNGVQVGIDLEKQQSVSSREFIIRQYFSRLDNEYFEGLSEEEKRSAFLCLWTLKEAYAKALGTGFAAAPEFDYFDKDLFRQMYRDYVVIYPRDDFWFVCFAPQEDYISSSAIMSSAKPTPRFYLYEHKKGT